MKREDVFASPNFQAEDLADGEELTMKIVGDELVTYNRKDGKGQENKCCLKFEGHEQTLPLNQTNWDFLEDALKKDDSSQWIGAWIVLTKQKVDFMGKRVWGLRITKAAFPKSKNLKHDNSQSKQTPPPIQDQSKTASDANEEIPF